MKNLAIDKERDKKPNLIAMIIIYSMPNTIILALSPASIGIGSFFGVTSQSGITYITTIAVLGYAIGPLFSPYYSIKHGRRGTILFGIYLVLIGIIGSLIFIFIFKSYSLMLTMRFISALGGGIALTGIPAIINDYYDEVTARKTIFTLTGIYCLWPGIALLICGLLTHSFGWVFTEYFLLLYGILGLISAIVLPETMKKKFETENPLKLYLSTCGGLLKNIEFIGYCLIGAFGGIVIYYFIADAPFILITKLQYSTKAYGYIVMIPYVASFISLLIGSFAAKKISFNFSVKLGSVVFLLFSIVMLIMFAINYINIFSFVILSSIIIMTIFISYSYSFANAVKLTNARVTATSLFIFIAIAISAIVTQISKSISFGTITYPVIFTVLSIIFIIISISLIKHTRNKKAKEL